jgi:hypothetical protein
MSDECGFVIVDGIWISQSVDEQVERRVSAFSQSFAEDYLKRSGIKP